MTPTPDQLRSQLAALQARYDGLFAELAPKAQADRGGRAKWTDGSVAAWLGLSTDCLRGMIVHLDGFAVGGEGCTFALLDVREILALLQFRSARAAEIDFLLRELAAVTSYLSDLGLGPQE